MQMRMAALRAAHALFRYQPILTSTGEEKNNFLNASHAECVRDTKYMSYYVSPLPNYKKSRAAANGRPRMKKNENKCAKHTENFARQPNVGGGEITSHKQCDWSAKTSEIVMRRRYAMATKDDEDEQEEDDDWKTVHVNVTFVNPLQYV